MTDIEQLFLQNDDTFTIFVVEQRFAIGRGYEYFHSLQNSPNFINSDEEITKVFAKAIETISKNVAPVEKLINLFCSGFTGLSIAEAITSLCQLFTVNEHQFAGPNIIDPIILLEGKISKRGIAYLVNLHRDSNLRPSIIIILKDNDFERAKGLLSECPDGINVKFIYNGKPEEMYKVVNCGATDIISFIDSFSKQCYSTCSNTDNSLLLNTEWAENSIVKLYSPTIFKYRSSLLCDQKNEIKTNLSNFTDLISGLHDENDEQEKILRAYECIAKLYRVFCNDLGGTDIIEARKIAADLNHELLLAQTYRYAEFMPDCSTDEKVQLYKKGTQIFRKYSMVDHALYCTNNMLVEQFYTENVYPEMFKDMQVEAVNNVPGMAGLSHIYNNVGVAYLYCGLADIAIDYFNRGLEHAQTHRRIVQNLALESNKIIAECYSLCTVDENRIWFLMRKIFDGMGENNLPFLAADYALNVLAVAYKQNVQLGKDLIKAFPVLKLVQLSFDSSYINSSERVLQLQFLEDQYGDAFPILRNCRIPSGLYKTRGKRQEFIIRYGLNPFDLEIWL